MAVVAAVLLFGGGIIYERWRLGQETAVPVVEKGEEADLRKATEAGAAPREEKTVKVHVTGAVERPGVYQLLEDARVAEAVHLAGPLPEADVHALNLAAPLMDGQQIVVPRKGEEGQSVFPSSVAGGAGSKVNINRADVNELATLPGIGPTLARRIVEYREKHGPYRSVEDIQNVSGIGPKRFEDIKDLITVY